MEIFRLSHAALSDRVAEHPREIEEAARIDGANSFQNFFYVTLPLLGSTIKTSVYLSVLGSIQQFIIVWVMTRGGPVNASETMATICTALGSCDFNWATVQPWRSSCFPLHDFFSDLSGVNQETRLPYRIIEGCEDEFLFGYTALE